MKRIDLSNEVCSYCGKSHYSVEYSTFTDVYYIPIYQDEKLINNNSNETITTLKCLGCEKRFTSSSKDNNVNTLKLDCMSEPVKTVFNA